MRKNLPIIISLAAILIIAVSLYFAPAGRKIFDFSHQTHTNELMTDSISELTRARFDYLSQNGNSVCSADFRNTILDMNEGERIRGSCCSAMSLHKYSEQVEGLKKYAIYSEIPSDPYDIDAALAKKMSGYYDLELSEKEQKAYDYAMLNSHEKGPCCCKCWRWYFYGGLAKYLIHHYNFNGEQITEIWNLSDGCGGEEH